MQTAKKMEQLQEVSNKMKKYLFILFQPSSYYDHDACHRCDVK